MLVRSFVNPSLVPVHDDFVLCMMLIVALTKFIPFLSPTKDLLIISFAPYILYRMEFYNKWCHLLLVFFEENKSLASNMQTEGNNSAMAAIFEFYENRL